MSLNQGWFRTMKITDLAGRLATLAKARYLSCPLFLLFMVLFPSPSHADVKVTCGGKALHISLQLSYRWPGGGNLGAVFKPDLSIKEDLKTCTFEELYLKLLSRREVVVRHSTGEKPRVVMTIREGERNWRRSGDYGAIMLHESMRIWLTIFNSPKAARRFNDI